jgi:KDO2-lipid IV(A) lauroyltransferase
MCPEVKWESHPDSEEELLINTRHHVNAVQKHIYEMPEEWFWLHRRWKIQPEGVANPYK